MLHGNAAAQHSHSLRQNRPALQYLRLMQENWERGIDTYGDVYNTAMARLVLMGWIEHRVYDLSDIAQALRISRQQAARRAVGLSKHGWIAIKRDYGERSQATLWPTDKLVAEAVDKMSRRVPQAIAKWAQIAAALGTAWLAG